MSALTITAAGPVPADEAWDRYARPDRWAQWAPQIRGVTVSAPRIAAGVTGTMHGPLGVSADFRINSVDEDARRWAWTVRRWPLTVKLQHGVRATPTGSSTWLVIDAPLAVAFAYAPLARYALQRLVSKRQVGR